MNKQTATDCATLIAVAYAQRAGGTSAMPTDLSAITIEDTLTVHENFEQVPFGFVASVETGAGDHIAYVVLRGTSTLLEWLDDGFAVPCEVTFCNCAPPPPLLPPAPASSTHLVGHTTDGYEAIYRQLSPQIVKTLVRLKPTAVIVTGHSLGGALAVLAVVDIWNNLRLRAESYTFCAPRTGDPAFAKAFAAAGFVSTRIYNTEDLVPTLPPATTELLTTATALAKFLEHVNFNGLFQHIGTPVPVTFNLGSLEANHDLANLLAALPA